MSYVICSILCKLFCEESKGIETCLLFFFFFIFWRLNQTTLSPFSILNLRKRDCHSSKFNNDLDDWTNHPNPLLPKSFCSTGEAILKDFFFNKPFQSTFTPTQNFTDMSKLRRPALAIEGNALWMLNNGQQWSTMYHVYKEIDGHSNLEYLIACHLKPTPLYKVSQNYCILHPASKSRLFTLKFEFHPNPATSNVSHIETFIFSEVPFCPTCPTSSLVQLLDVQLLVYFSDVKCFQRFSWETQCQEQSFSTLSWNSYCTAPFNLLYHSTCLYRRCF